jgi:DNA modification methylase
VAKDFIISCMKNKRKNSTKNNKEMVAETLSPYGAKTVQSHYEPVEPTDSLLDNIIEGDNLTILKSIPGNKINLIITSPPYFRQRDYGSGIGNEKTVDEYINNLIHVFSECVRILKTEGSIIFNLNGAKTKRTNSNNIGKKYFELIESSNLTLEQKKMALCELQEVIEEVKMGKLESFRMKIKGIHSEPFGGQDGGRKYQLLKKGFTIIKIKGEPIKRDVIECAVETIKGCKHPAIYPLYIIKELIKLLSKENDIILDPFMGSGTTAVAAKELNRKYIGIEINGEYCKYARERLKNSYIKSP